MSPEELKQLQQIIESLTSIGALSWAAIPVAITAVVNLYKLPSLQGLLEERAPKLAWANLPLVAKLGVPFVVAGVGAFVTAKAGAVSMPAAVIGAVVAGVMAVLTHHGAKTVARTEPVTAAMAKLPVSVSRPLSLVAPVDWAEVMAKRVRPKLRPVPKQ